MTSTLLLYWRAQVQGKDIHTLRWSRELKPASRIRRWAWAASRLGTRKDSRVAQS